MPSHTCGALVAGAQEFGSQQMEYLRQVGDGPGSVDASLEALFQLRTVSVVVQGIRS